MKYFLTVVISRMMQGQPLPLHCGNLSEYSLAPGISVKEKHTHIQIPPKSPIRTKALADYELLATGEWKKWWYGVPYHILKEAYDGSRKRKEDFKARYASLAWDVKELPQKKDFQFVQRYYQILADLGQGEEERFIDPYKFLSHLPVTPMPDVKPPPGYKLLQEAPPVVRGVSEELWRQNQENEVGTLFVEIERDPESEDEESEGEGEEKGSSTAAKGKGGVGVGKGAVEKQAPVAAVDEDVLMRSGEEDEDEDEEDEDEDQDEKNEDEDEDEETGDRDEDDEGNLAGGDGDSVGRKGDNTEHSDDPDAPFAWYSNSDSETKGLPSGRGTKRDRSPGPLSQFSAWGGIDEHFTDSSDRTIRRLMSATQSPPRKVRRGKIYAEPQTEIGTWPAP